MHPLLKITTAALIASFFMLPGNSQELKIDETTGKYVSGNTLGFDSLGKDTLFKKTYKWMFTEYPNTGDKGTYIDASKNKIVAHEYFIPDPEGLWNFTNLRIGFILTCEFKDRKLKYGFSDFYYYSLGDGKVPFESQKFRNYDVLVRDVMLKVTNEHIKNLIAELSAYLQKFNGKTPVSK
jgi:hypothetical protein